MWHQQDNSLSSQTWNLVLALALLVILSKPTPHTAHALYVCTRQPVGFLACLLAVGCIYKTHDNNLPPRRLIPLPTFKAL